MRLLCNDLSCGIRFRYGECDLLQDRGFFDELFSHDTSIAATLDDDRLAGVRMSGS